MRPVSRFGSRLDRLERKLGGLMVRDRVEVVCQELKSVGWPSCVLPKGRGAVFTLLDHYPDHILEAGRRKLEELEARGFGDIKVITMVISTQVPPGGSAIRAQSRAATEQTTSELRHSQGELDA